jgi:hypothetical protein
MIRDGRSGRIELRLDPRPPQIKKQMVKQIQTLLQHGILERSQSPYAITAAVAKCTTMHFLNDTDPIFLHTDASDYGIGGYLFQVVDGYGAAWVPRDRWTERGRWGKVLA